MIKKTTTGTIQPSIGRGLTHVAERILNVPLMVHPAKADAILAVLGGRLGLNSEVIPVVAASTSDNDQQHEYNVRDGIASIPVFGVLVKKASGLDPQSGITSYEALTQMIRAAVVDRSVRGIILDCDSPGGEVGGLFDLSDMIFQLRNVKPVIALVNDSSYSACYALASAASKVFISREGGCGSIGVYTIHVDQSAMDKAKGLSYTYVFSGSKKLDGNAHQPLAEDVRNSIQSEIDRLYGMFTSLVARNRNCSVQQVVHTQAGCFHGTDALPLLADWAGPLGKVAGWLRSGNMDPATAIAMAQHERLLAMGKS